MFLRVDAIDVVDGSLFGLWGVAGGVAEVAIESGGGEVGWDGWVVELWGEVSDFLAETIADDWEFVAEHDDVEVVHGVTAGGVAEHLHQGERCGALGPLVVFLMVLQQRDAEQSQGLAGVLFSGFGSQRIAHDDEHAKHAGDDDDAQQHLDEAHSQVVMFAAFHGCGTKLRGDQVRLVMSLTNGMKRAMTMKPTIPPSTTTMIGSSRETRASTMTSTSSS